MNILHILHRPRLRAQVALALGATLALYPAGDSSASSRVTCGGLRATIVGTADSEIIVGTRGDDVIAARGGYDTVVGRGGDDVICGGYGADRLSGGKGHDRLYGGPGGVKDDRSGTYINNDWLSGGRGNDVIMGGRDPRDLPAPNPDIVDYTYAPRGLHVDLSQGVATGQGHDTLSVQAWGVNGSRFDDVIIGSRYGDHLSGNLGTDVLEGRAGPDVLGVDGYADSIDVDTGVDILRGQRGDDYLSSAGGTDLLYGGPGDDELAEHGGGVDRIYGGAGDDWVRTYVTPEEGQVLSGGPGSNRIDLTVRVSEETGAPDGVMDLRSGLTTIAWDPPMTVETTGFTTVRLPDSVWTVYGTDADEYFWSAFRGQRTIFAGGGDDYLGGSPGDDYLDGGDGHDRAEPGRGFDTCVSIEESVYGDCEQSGG